MSDKWLSFHTEPYKNIKEPHIRTLGFDHWLPVWTMVIWTLLEIQLISWHRCCLLIKATNTLALRCEAFGLAASCCTQLLITCRTVWWTYGSSKQLQAWTRFNYTKHLKSCSTHWLTYFMFVKLPSLFFHGKNLCLYAFDLFVNRIPQKKIQAHLNNILRRNVKRPKEQLIKLIGYSHIFRTSSKWEI